MRLIYLSYHVHLLIVFWNICPSLLPPPFLACVTARAKNLVSLVLFFIHVNALSAKRPETSFYSINQTTGLLTTHPCGFPKQFQQHTHSFCVPQSLPCSEPACLFKSQHSSPWPCTTARRALSLLLGSFLSFLWALSLAVPSVWNTVSADLHGAAFPHYSGLSSNVTSSEKPFRNPGQQKKRSFLSHCIHIAQFVFIDPVMVYIVYYHLLVHCLCFRGFACYTEVSPPALEGIWSQFNKYLWNECMIVGNSESGFVSWGLQEELMRQRGGRPGLFFDHHHHCCDC